MLCPRCGTNNPDTNSICAQCGEPLVKVAAPGSAPGDTLLNGQAPQNYRPVPLPEPSTEEGHVPGWYTPPAPAPSAASPAYQAPADQPPAYQHSAYQPQVSQWPMVSGSVPPARAVPQRSPLPPFGSLASAPPAGSIMPCGVCGAPTFPGQPRCVRCQSQPGTIVNPNDPTATTSLPFGPPVALTPLFRAGEQAAPADQGDQVSGFNWGAALTPTIWAARHRIGWLAGVSGLLTTLLISLFLLRAWLHRTPDASGTLTGFLVVCALMFGLPRSLFAGLRGNTFALRSGVYPNRESLRKAQRSWTVWAIIGTVVLSLLLGMAAAFLNSA